VMEGRTVGWGDGVGWSLHFGLAEVRVSGAEGFEMDEDLRWL